MRVEYEINRSYLTILECRAPWRAEAGSEWTRFPIARLRYTHTSATWTLYWRDRNLRFHRYDPHRAVGERGSVDRRDRPRPDRHLLGVTPDVARLTRPGG